MYQKISVRSTNYKIDKISLESVFHNFNVTPKFIYTVLLKRIPLEIVYFFLIFANCYLLANLNVQYFLFQCKLPLFHKNLLQTIKNQDTGRSKL